jgi:hypothetical protein
MKKQTYACSQSLMHLFAIPLYSCCAGLFERQFHGNQTHST